jgi:hypothetical protein
MSSYLSILIFLLTTAFYYIAIKKPLKVGDLTVDGYGAFAQSNYIRLFIYFLLVILTQFGFNISAMSSKCGGSISQNMGAAALLTFIPWTFIFGMVILCLIMFPGFKSAFSNVIGYFIVSNSANSLFADKLLKAPEEVETAITNAGTDAGEQSKLKIAAEAIIKICGNLSILINNITPANFMEYWIKLTPLMKDGVSVDVDLKQKLLDIVVQRDNVGEGLWYIYTAVLLTSIVQYNMATRPCTQDLATVQASYQGYLEQDKANQAAANQGATEYTVGN